MSTGLERIPGQGHMGEPSESALPEELAMTFPQATGTQAVPLCFSLLPGFAWEIV